MKAAATLRTIRHRSGLALRELARRAGTSHATLHTYESGAKEPRVDTIDRIAAAAGFDLDLQLTRRADGGAARAAKGRELVDALLVAEQFPARHRRRLAAPVRPSTVNLPEKIVALHLALDAADIPHAFGGALALAWCTQRARGTVDIDLNLFLGADAVDRVVDALPEGVVATPNDLTMLRRDGQARLWWGETPVDLFFNTTPFHEAAAARVRHEPFLGDSLPFLACRDLAVFKAFFNRSQDWVDLEMVAEAGTLDVEAVLGVLAHYLGAPDERIDRLRALSPP